MIEFRVVPDFLKCKPWRNLLSVGSKSIFGYGVGTEKYIHKNFSTFFPNTRDIHFFQIWSTVDG